MPLLITILLSGLLYNAKGDSLFYNSKKPTSDKILLYDKQYFIWIKTDTSKILDDIDSVIYITFGQYKTLGDTIYFSLPDTTQKPNKYFCYCASGGDKSKSYRLYNKPETFPIGSIDRVYKTMFETQPPNAVEICVLISRKAIRQKGKIKIFDDEFILTDN